MYAAVFLFTVWSAGWGHRCVFQDLNGLTNSTEEQGLSQLEKICTVALLLKLASHYLISIYKLFLCIDHLGLSYIMSQT